MSVIYIDSGRKRAKSEWQNVLNQALTERDAALERTIKIEKIIKRIKKKMKKGEPFPKFFSLEANNG